MRILLLSAMLLFLFPLISVCQSKQFLYYFDKDFNPAAKETATFNGVGVKQDNLMEFKVYNSKNNSLVMLQHFTDSSLKISEGLFTEFYQNGKEKSIGNYSQGKEEGLWQRRDTSGNVIDSSFYESGNVTKYIHRGFFKSGFPDSIIVNDLEKNELQRTFYFDSGVIANTVFFKGNTGYLTIYDKGIISRIDTVSSREENEAYFPGGEAAWSKYIVKGLQSNAKELFKENIFGTCSIKFIVDKEGKVKDVVAQTMKGTKLAEVAVGIIKRSPKWKPASQYGRLVNAYRIQPVTLLDPD